MRFLLRRNDKKGVGFELFLWKKANEKEVFELKKGKTKLPIPPKKIKKVVVFSKKFGARGCFQFVLTGFLLRLDGIFTSS